jgi:AcrR family transcriptional regulator
MLGPVTRKLFTVDELLDAARTVVLERGPRAATLAAIARAANAPVGSIYHRFDSVDDLLASAWLRAVARTHAALAAVAPDSEKEAEGTAVDRIVALALAAYDHCVSNPADAVLLDRLRRGDVLAMNISAELLDQIHAQDVVTKQTVAEVAGSFFETTKATDRDRVVLAVVDLPYSFAQRYLLANKQPPRTRRALLPAAVHAILAEVPTTP